MNNSNVKLALISLKIIILITNIVISIVSLILFIHNSKKYINKNDYKYYLIIAIYPVCIVINSLLIIFCISSLKFKANKFSISSQCILSFLIISFLIILTVLSRAFQKLNADSINFRNLKILGYTQLSLALIGVLILVLLLFFKI